jgi:hypothetical protein
MEAAQEPVKIENAPEKSTLDRSTIRFPYLDQDDSVELAKKVFELGGKSCDKIALASAFNVSAEGGAFGLRLATAKMFGFITTEKKTISLTDLGQRVVDPATEKPARAESLLEVPLYKKLYDDYQGQLLPGNDGLESHVVKLGVAPKQKDKARQVFQRSAKQAGYFSIASNRLAAPQFKPGIDSRSNGASDSDGNEGKRKEQSLTPPPPPPQGPDLPPYVQLLVSKLPEPETMWGMSGRKKWLEAALKIFDLVYVEDPADSEEGLTITLGSITSGKSSAN